MAARTLGERLREATARLEAAGIPEARLKAEWALSAAVNCRRLELPLRYHDPAPDGGRFEDVMAALLAGQPLQYALGETDFMGLAIRCDGRALIPRPETEELTQAVLDHAALWSRPCPVIADVGTGTGCIVLALAARRPRARYLAIDASPEALALARENARRLGLEERIEFIEADLLTGVPAGALDAVVANPPYIPTGVWARLPCWIRDAEPRQALDGGPDGLSAIRALAPQAFTSLRAGGIVFMELGDGQADFARGALSAAGFEVFSSQIDLSGIERIAVATKG